MKPIEVDMSPKAIERRMRLGAGLLNPSLSLGKAKRIGTGEEVAAARAASSHILASKPKVQSGKLDSSE